MMKTFRATNARATETEIQEEVKKQPVKDEEVKKQPVKDRRNKRHEDAYQLICRACKRGSCEGCSQCICCRVPGTGKG